MNLIERYYVKNKMRRNRHGNIIYEYVDINQMNTQLLYELKYKAVEDTIHIFNDTTGDYEKGWAPSYSNSCVFFTSEFVKDFKKQKKPIGVVMVAYKPII